MWAGRLELFSSLVERFYAAPTDAEDVKAELWLIHCTMLTFLY